MEKLTSWNIYRGKLIANIVTAVEHDDEEKMTEKAHEDFTAELFSEIQSLLGARGYISHDIGADLKNIGRASEDKLVLIEESKQESKRKANRVYNKANQITINFSQEP